LISEKQRNVKKLQKESNILKNVSSLILELGSELPLLNKVSFTRVVLSDDKSLAKVFVYSSFGKDLALDFIKSLIPYIPSIKTSLSRVSDFRRVPNLRFLYDCQYEKVQYIESLIDSVPK
jgi:ribosome-binding factor A